MRFGVASLTVVLGGLCFGCGGPGAQSADNRPLPAYAGHATELFDDAIEPKAVGLELDQTSSARKDPLFRERAQLSDVVVRARVSTVTGRVEGVDTTYQIGFRVLETLGGKHPVGEEFNVRFAKGNPSSGILRSFEGRLVGKTMVVFVRTFVRPDADQELHLHAVADTKDVIDAAKQAVSADDLKK